MTSLDYDDLPLIAAEQRRELMAAEALDSDLDFAFNLQVQEAITASLARHDQPSTSSAPTIPSIQHDQNFPKFSNLLSEEIVKLEQERKDRAISQMEFRKLTSDLHRSLHDHEVAMEISGMPDEEWENWGDNYERPFGEGCSKGVNSEIFKVYFKGLVEELPKGIILGGIGVAICDSRDELLFELRKPLVGASSSRQNAELRALIEALKCALELDLKMVVFYCDYYSIFKFVTGQWSARKKKDSVLVSQISSLQQKFTSCQPSLVARNDIKFAFKLAREAIVSQFSRAAEESSTSRTSLENCVICFEDTDVSQVFSVDNCKHRYCFTCMKQHVEVKLLHGILPMCPHENCKTELKLDSCYKFLSPRLIEIMSQRIKEASIPITEKIYCPYQKCSALMSKKEVLEYSKIAIVGAERCGTRKCIKCMGYFCIFCKVPWHYNMTCFDYKRRNPHPPVEEAKLKLLAASNLWRQCVKCNHMIELAAGCYHMTCRCGYEFCYTCGAEWKNKKATCSCPLWDDGYIIADELEDDDEDYESDPDEFY